MAQVKTKKPVKVEVEADTPNPMSVQLIALKDMKESPRNSKKHSEEQIDAIVRSIQELGYRDPIAVDGSGEIIEGHGRRLALMKMGVEVVPALVFEDMTAEQVRAYRIAHNKLPLMEGFDLEILASELHDLSAGGFDFTVTGFSGTDLDTMDLQLDTSFSEDSGDLSGNVVLEVEKPKKEKAVKEPTQSILQYALIFDDKEQQVRWQGFIKYLKENVEGDTIAARIDQFLQTVFTEE